MIITDLLLLGVGTFGMVWLLVYGTGPGAILSRFRQWVGVRYTDKGERYGENWAGELFNCPICLSVWIGTIMTILIMFGLQWLVAPMFAVGIVTLITEVTNG